MKTFEPVPEEIEVLAKQVIDAAFKVHTALGPGLLESAYEACLERELTLRDIAFKSQVSLPVAYEGVSLDVGFRLDLLVADKLIVEIKAVEKPNPLFEAQLLTYLKLTNLRLGLLINFNSILIKDGIRRIVR